MLISTGKLNNLYDQTKNKKVEFQIILVEDGIKIHAWHLDKSISGIVLWADIIQNRIDVTEKIINEMEEKLLK